MNIKSLVFLALASGIIVSSTTWADELPANLFTEPVFTASPDGSIVGWRQGGFVGGNPETNKNYDNSATLITENEQTFIRVNCDPSQPNFFNFAVTAPARFPLLPEWSSIELSARIKVSEYVQGSPWGGFNLWLIFYDVEGQKLDDSQTSLRIKMDQDWTDSKQVFQVPAGAVEVEFNLWWLAAGGVAEVSNLVLKPLAAAPEVQP